MEKFLAEVNLNSALLVILAVAWIWNLIYQAIQNGKRTVNDSKAPFNRIDGTINEIRSKCELHIKSMDDRIDTIERRLDEHDKMIKDMHDGLSVLCRGVQASLDHSLHKDNEAEVKAASDCIGKWLRTR